jgi:haloalkane dehalogenase
LYTAIPTSSFLWREVLGELVAGSPCVAVDLIGMGLSGKPDIDYTVTDHAAYLQAFVDRLALRDITGLARNWCWSRTSSARRCSLLG